MPRFRVIAKRLNTRRQVPLTFPERETITGEVREGFTFEAEEVLTVPNPNLGKWYKDRNGTFYWGGGIESVSEAEPEEPVQRGATKANEDWWLEEYRIRELWNASKGDNIKVALLDSGLNLLLDDFKNNPNISYYNAILDSTDKNTCGDDAFGHGTDCAAILCAQGRALLGVAPGLSLLVIKIADHNGQRTTAAILKGLQEAIRQGADIISMSFSIPTDANFNAIHQVIRDAHNANITVLAAAGDSGELGFPVDEFPASFAECLSIGGVTRRKTRSSTSTLSNFLDVLAPGEDLFSITDPSTRISGTSFATPFAAGVIAILKSVYKQQNITLSNLILYDALKRAADKNITGYNMLEHGWGIIDPVNTLKLLSTIKF